MSESTSTNTLNLVRDHYAKIANSGSGSASNCCEPTCCTPTSHSATAAEAPRPADLYSAAIGYSEGELEAVPEGANLGLGCGNPLAIASLSPGEVVVDLGSGGGFDAILAARKVGPTGRVIGVDMTPEMLAKARKNAVTAEVEGFVEFREGTIDALPVVSESVDVIISNCVVNLAPDKAAVLADAFRVLRPGGRLAISDILVSEPLPAALTGIDGAYEGCLTGALVADDFLEMLAQAGFTEVTYRRRLAFDDPESAACADAPLFDAASQAIGSEAVADLLKTVFSYTIEASKPA